jgi:two-component system cell cycle response regulator DivK
VPILAITAYDTYGIEEAAREAGCDAYITKPLDMPHLEKTVSGFVYG